MKSLKCYIRAVRNRAALAYNSHMDFRTDRKILVLESDDWGSVRMSSRKSWEALKAMGYAVDKRPYERYDALETNSDVECLAGVLLKYTDHHGHHPVITANYLTANPDFEAIRINGFSEYVSEPIETTYCNYPASGKVINMMKDGLKEGVFMPQCHGREHLNVCSWMEALRRRDKDVLMAFSHNMCGISPKGDATRGNSYVVALRSRTADEARYVESAVKTALAEFRKLWGYSSISFVAPNYTWNDRIENILVQNGVEIMQTSRIQRKSSTEDYRYLYSGKASSSGLVYSIRNCQFEPSTSRRPDDEADSCLKQINQAFCQHKIAVVSTHRINYVSAIDGSNRENNLKRLDYLISEVLRRYPEVEFMSSRDLREILTK